MVRNGHHQPSRPVGRCSMRSPVTALGDARAALQAEVAVLPTSRPGMVRPHIGSHSSVVYASQNGRWRSGWALKENNVTTRARMIVSGPTLLAVSALAACGGGGGASDDSVSLNLGHVFTDGIPISQAAVDFASRVEETDGRVIGRSFGSVGRAVPCTDRHHRVLPSHSRPSLPDRDELRIRVVTVGSAVENG